MGVLYFEVNAVFFNHFGTTGATQMITYASKTSTLHLCSWIGFITFFKASTL